MFSNPNTLVYFRRNNILVAGKRIAAAKLNIYPETVNNMEVIDQAKFIESCQKFFTSRKVRGKRILLVLDKAIVFSKIADLTEASDAEAVTSGYIDAMPFYSGKRACVRQIEDKQLQLYATNGQLYQAVVDAIHSSGIGKLVAITPAEAYKLNNAEAGSAVDKFLSDKVVRQAFDFNTAALI